jgi:hypothetical protein
MTSIASLTSSLQILTSSQPQRMAANAPPVAAPAAVNFNAASTKAQAVAAALSLSGAASNSASSITLQRSGGPYETTGSKTVAVGTGVTSATETVDMRAGASYTIGTSFGLSSALGRMRVELLDPTGKLVQSVVTAAGKTSISLGFKATATGAFTIRLTGQPIAKTGVTTQIHQGYSVGVAQAQSKIPTSGDASIDALIFGGTNSWLHDAGALATRSTDYIKPGVNPLNSALSRPVRYAFMNADRIKTLTGADARGAAEMSDTQKAAVNDAFAYLGSVIALKFEQVSDPSQADIVFGQNNQNGTSAGYANPPQQSGSHAQYLFLASDQSTNGTFVNGSYGLTTLLHEIGHTLGLKHPGNYNAGGGGAPGPYLPKATDNRRYTMMSYYGAPGSSANPQTLMSYDVQALQYLYGANKTPTDAAALAKHQTTSFDDTWSGLETLWTPQGGEIDASATAKSNIVDFREGSFSSIAMSGTSANNNVALAWGAKLASAKGGAGADRFYTTATGDISADGGAGTDTLYLAGKASEWTRNGDVFTRKIGGKAVATVTAKNMETIAYYDPARTAALHA